MIVRHKSRARNRHCRRPFLEWVGRLVGPEVALAGVLWFSMLGVLRCD